MRSNLGSLRLSILTLLALSVDGCALDDGPVDTGFGDSVRRTIALQSAEPDRGARGMDGDKAETAIRAYRGEEVSGSAGKPAALEISLGGGQ
jgi:hypothetical protein